MVTLWSEEAFMAIKQIEEIRDSFMKRIGKTELKDDATLKDLGLDSLDVVEMCLDLEDRYGIHFEAEELGGFKTVGDLLNCIDKKLSA